MSDAKINDHSDEYMRLFDDAVERALLAIGIHLEGEAKEELSNAPERIDTGLLRNSITFALDGEGPAISSYKADNPSRYGESEIPSGSYSGTAAKESGGNRSVIIGTNVEYAQYVHEGTVRMSPNRFLKNALDRNREQINEYLKNELS